MKFGKFEIEMGVFVAIAVVLITYIVLHFTIEEERLKEQTKQLEIEKEIIMLKEGNYVNGK